MTSPSESAPYRKLSVIVPCYNEEATLDAVLEQVRAAPTAGLDMDILIIDDASADASPTIAARHEHADPRVRVIRHDTNRGKGAALRTGFAQASGDLVIIQDADLEYDPRDFEKLLAPMLAGEADVVYGSRFLSTSHIEAHYLLHGLANRGLTAFSNLLSGLKLTDMETCYKLVPKRLLEQITITENRFGIEPEITAKLARLKPRPRFREVAVAYRNRSYAEGKKIGWRDGLSAIRCIIKFNLGG